MKTILFHKKDLHSVTLGDICLTRRCDGFRVLDVEWGVRGIREEWRVTCSFHAVWSSIQDELGLILIQINTSVKPPSTSPGSSVSPVSLALTVLHVTLTAPALFGTDPLNGLITQTI